MCLTGQASPIRRPSSGALCKPCTPAPPRSSRRKHLTSSPRLLDRPHAPAPPRRTALPVHFPQSLAVRGEPDALAWAPGLSVVGRRLARRCWPGPVVLSLAGVVPETLPEEVRALVCGSDGLRLWTPDHEALLETLFQLDETIIVAGIDGTLQEIAAQADNDVDLIIVDGTSAGQSPTVVRLDGDGWSIVQPGRRDRRKR